MRITAFLLMLMLAACTRAPDPSIEPGEPDPLHNESGGSLRKSQGGANGDADYCNGAVPCTVRQGDCDSNAECAGSPGAICGTDNGARFSMPDSWDVCILPSCLNHVQDPDE